MSVFFDSPMSRREDLVAAGDAELLLENIGVTEGISPQESGQYRQLLAAVHDVAEHVLELPDYVAHTDTKTYPREQIHRPTEGEQDFGHAWAHKFLIRGSRAGELLRGKTVCLKDNIAVAGVPQFFGTDAIPAWTPHADATVVSRALVAGADIVGTTICENFCKLNLIIHVPSGGCAVVGGGLVDIAIGADQGGSIRVPSSFCGYNQLMVQLEGVGLKPTHGLVPYTGISSGDAVNDHAGPIARCVADVASCLDAISGRDDFDDRTLGAPKFGSGKYLSNLQPSVNGMKIGVLTEGLEHRLVDEDVKAIVMRAASSFKRLGANGAGGLFAITSGRTGHLDHSATYCRYSSNARDMHMERRGLFSTAYEAARQAMDEPRLSRNSCAHPQRTPS
ncbi:hypothetical protein SNOG_04881 [Parastagonospora nodorum SN15]|uniref:Amidase domain-containing protein n=1 Tax=Phaeosphaeria nodorum (strain SN15 / ATCC MYA-4574 / FGSC 10173) TaxID=321614 RepID=Q0UTN3_PHANO|nr:hypothetical protein SNOG_04881 [Parastagonospora nodorum SN15]EAT87272.1 hypothetical protein SNOG_04881 [Parastagonospora nodorum SN15]